jgi:hypothetical protein
VTSAFFYLTGRSFYNRMRVRVRRLREPRYLLGLSVGVLYFYGVIFRPGSGTHIRTTSVTTSLLASVAEPVIALASVVLLVVVALSWLWPSSAKAVAFSKAEVQFLFPAPLTRRQLLHYKLIRSQTASLIGSFIVTIFLRPGSLVSAWTVVTGMWLVFGILNLHFTGVALARESLVEHGASGAKRQWLPMAIIVGAVGTIAFALVKDGAALSSATHVDQVFRELARVLTTGAAGWALWPTRAIVSLPLAPTATAYWRALPGALFLLALNYVWVMRSDAAFQEASAEQSEKVVRGRRAPAQARLTKVSAPFTLAATGRAEMAILWKNLILLGRYASLRNLWRLVPLVLALAIGATGSRKTGLVEFVSILVMAGAGLTILIGPQMARNDLRQDLNHIALLKTWPIRSAALLRGEILAPAALLTGVVWLFLVGSIALVTKIPSSAGAFATVALDRLSYGVAAMVLAPMLIIVQLIVHNGLAVLFPAWAMIGATRSRGVEVMGQRLLMQAAIWISLLLAVLPAALVAGGVAVAIYLATGVIPIIFAAVFAAAIILAEAFLATEALGRALDRTDVGSLEPQD